MRPLVKILLRNGIAYGSFTEMVRKIYVDVAYEKLLADGKRPTISAISGVTGLTRKEAKRLNETALPDFETSGLKHNRAARVISGWQHDRNFQDSAGRPGILPVSGKNSFTELTKKYSGDIPVAAMLSILRDGNCISEKDGTLELITSSYISDKDSDEKIQILGSDTSELLQTINHNLTNKGADLWYQRKVSNFNLDQNYLDEFKKISAAKTQKLLEELDTWLSKHEVANRAEDSECYVALGAYYFEERQLEKNNEY